MELWHWILLLLILAALFYFWSRAKSRQSGLPLGRVVYTDTDLWQELPSPLYDPQLHLTGKPDYVVHIKDGALVPVEVKSTPAPQQPYDSHIMQLGAYCWLLKQTEGTRPPFGLLRYRDKTFQIDYTDQLESQLVNLVRTIRQAEAKLDGPNPSHHDPTRCRKCGYRHICDRAVS